MLSIQLAQIQAMHRSDAQESWQNLPEDRIDSRGYYELPKSNDTNDRTRPTFQRKRDPAKAQMTTLAVPGRANADQLDRLITRSSPMVVGGKRAVLGKGPGGGQLHSSENSPVIRRICRAGRLSDPPARFCDAPSPKPISISSTPTLRTPSSISSFSNAGSVASIRSRRRARSAVSMVASQGTRNHTSRCRCGAWRQRCLRFDGEIVPDHAIARPQRLRCATWIHHDASLLFVAASPMRMRASRAMRASWKIYVERALSWSTTGLIVHWQLVRLS